MFTNEGNVTSLPWRCDFGMALSEEETCGFIQDASNEGLWELFEGETTTLLTGPLESEIAQRSTFATSI